MNTTARHRPLGKRHRRGGTLLLVIGVLSVLTLLAVTLTYTSKLEVQSSQNFAAGTQTRIAATTALRGAARTVAESVPMGPVGPLQLQFGISRRAADGDLVRVARPSGSEFASVEGAAPGAARELEEAPSLEGVVLHDGETFRVVDASGMININTASVDVLERLFEQAARRASVGVNARAVAAEIVARRFGPDGKPGRAGFDDDEDRMGSLAVGQSIAAALRRHGVVGSTVRTLDQPSAAATRLLANPSATVAGGIFGGTDELDEYLPDTRRPARGDDRRWDAVSELAQIDGLRPEVLAEAAPYLTTFSAALETRRTTGGRRPVLDLNRASASAIVAAIEDAYEGAPRDPTLIRQFAANLVDARDADRVPTVIEDLDGTAVLGFECTPVISEIYAHVPQMDGAAAGDGQFVELANPWKEAFDLTGWSLEGDGGRIALNGTLAARGYLIVTNDRDSRLDNSAGEQPGSGSLYDIFGVVAAGPGRRVMEARQLALPTRGEGRREVRLMDPQGRLVDVLRFVPARIEEGGRESFQRPAFAFRSAAPQRATPFSVGEGFVADLGFSESSDAPFTALTDVFGVSQAFASADGSRRSRWSEVSMSAESDETRLDARLVDLFTLESERRRAREVVARNLRDADGDGRLNEPETPSIERALAGRVSTRRASGEGFDLYYEAPIGRRLGLINLNTASAMVLGSIPELTEGQVRHLEARRLASLGRARAGGSGDGLAYRSLGELLADSAFWQAGGVRDADRLEAFEALRRRVTVTSASFFLVGRDGESSNETVGISETPRAQAFVSVDRPSPEILYLRVGQ